jgi:hypothetical protein
MRFCRKIGASLADDHGNSQRAEKSGSLGVAVILDISGHAPCDFAAK